ncbi:hypothetical protein C5167_043072 [Papaver somniferum]|uniref:SAND domain-containing protein n=1 Tax=Papaver somniferum TaxID=3469 RepID=A0A4Y7L8B7_PAPSO|nr:protein ULTRAPETALA 1-like [Papaver somniferum]RZC80499.1 hypothetical protein C5167_043072 [Papaver somniferum]
MGDSVEKECVSAASSMFSVEELNEISGSKRGLDYIEVTCGCTSHRYGDAVGRLRVFINGDLEISCECTSGCQEDKLTPAAFEKHSGRETARKWKSNVWVIKKGSKVPLFKTVLLKYYEQALKETNKSSLRSKKGRPCHRDEFVSCTECNKSRRFHLTSKEECRVHHDASVDANWKCSDLPFDNLSCEDDEERASRRVYRGCSRSQTCSGCTTCVCFGCDLCRFSDCNCQTCTDYTRNAKP